MIGGPRSSAGTQSCRLTQRRCDNAIVELANSENPRVLGDRLVGGGYKYRFGDYRLIYDVEYSLTLLELYDVGKRGRIY